MHVHLYLIVLGSEPIGRHYGEFHGAVAEIDGVGAVCHVIVHGLLTFGVDRGELASRHPVEKPDNGHETFGARTVRHRVGIENFALDKVYREEDSVEMSKHTVVFRELERVHRHTRRCVLSGLIPGGVAAHKGRHGYHGGQAQYCKFFHLSLRYFKLQNYNFVGNRANSFD